MRQGGRGEEPHEGNAHPPLPQLVYSDRPSSANVQTNLQGTDGALTGPLTTDTLHSPMNHKNPKKSRELMKLPAFLPLVMLAAMAFSVSSCSVRPREDVRFVEYSVPGLAGPECSQELLRVVSRVEGVINATPDTTNRTVLVNYDSRVTAQKNIEHAIAAGGFDVDDTPADPQAKAKLPASCQ